MCGELKSRLDAGFFHTRGFGLFAAAQMHLPKAPDRLTSQ